MKSNKEFMIRMIPLEQFIDILIELYDEGVDYIDLTAAPNGEQDVININVKEEYINVLSREEDIPQDENDLTELA